MNGSGWRGKATEASQLHEAEVIDQPLIARLPLSLHASIKKHKGKAAPHNTSQEILLHCIQSKLSDHGFSNLRSCFRACLKRPASLGGGSQAAHPRTGRTVHCFNYSHCQTPARLGNWKGLSAVLYSHGNATWRYQEDPVRKLRDAVICSWSNHCWNSQRRCDRAFSCRIKGHDLGTIFRRATKGIC